MSGRSDPDYRRRYKREWVMRKYRADAEFAEAMRVRRRTWGQRNHERVIEAQRQRRSLLARITGMRISAVRLPVTTFEAAGEER